MRIRSLSLVTSVIAGAALALVPADGAQAATTVGSTVTGNQPCAAGKVFWNTGGPGVVPSNGVITSLTTATTSTSGTIAFVVLRGTTVVGATPTTSISASGTASVSGVSIPVQQGDLLGVWTGSGSGFSCTAGSTTDAQADALAPTEPSSSSTVAVADSGTADVAVSGSLEPDVDGDGYGDDTQDACPADASRHLAPCTADLSVTSVPQLTSIGVGDLDVADVAVSNPDTGAATNVVLALSTTPGAQLVETSVPCSLGTTSQCQVGTIASGATQHVIVVVKGLAIGAAELSATVSGFQPDSNATNNAASASIQIVKRITLQCVVPKLAGLTKAAAAKKLKAKDCALGRVTFKKNKLARGKVIAQTRKPGFRLAYGTKVGITLGK